MVPFALPGRRPLFEEEATTIVGQLDGATGQRFSMSEFELLAIDQGENQAVDEQWAELLHKVERESRFTRADSVQVTEIGIETDLLKSTVNSDAEHSITEGKQAVGRVEGRATGSAGNSTWREKSETLEVVAGRAPFDTEDFGQCSGFAEVGQCGRVPFGNVPQPGLAVTGGVSRRPQQQLPVVVQLAGHNRPRNTEPAFACS